MKILGLLIILAGFILFAQYQIPAAVISILIGSVFLAQPGKPRAKESDADIDSEASDSEIVHVEAPLQKVRAISSSHRRLAFPVDGVTGLNDDGSSRQEILKALCSGENMAVAEVWFDDFLFGGKLSIRVMTESGCVGLIRSKDVMTVRSYFGKAVKMIYLEIGSQLIENGSEIYRADVVIIEETDSESAD